MILNKRHALIATAMFFVVSISGCHSAFIQTTVTNDSGKGIRLFEIDYPNASFGSGELAPGATFRYRFKILGDGPLKLTWTDAAGGEHNSKGPDVHEGVEGQLNVSIAGASARWTPRLH